MTKSVIQDATYWLNTTPSDNGVSDILITASIMKLLTNSNFDKLTIDFGSYTQVHMVTKNTTKSRKIGSNELQSEVELYGY